MSVPGFDIFDDRFVDGLWNANDDKFFSPIAFRIQTAFSLVTFRERGVDALQDACKRIGESSIFVVSTKSGWRRYRNVIEAANVSIADIFDRAEPHCPEKIVDEARIAFGASDTKIVVAIGGGSTLGIGKILSAEEGARFIAIPTTYSGSEMTQIYGRKIGLEKKTKKDTACIPAEVIYDPLLSRSLPISETAQSGMNSLAHSIEALFTNSADTMTEKAASIAISVHRNGLPRCVEDPNDRRGRALAALGGFLGGMLVQRHGIALHHQLCHVLGGLFDLPHGVSNSAVLAHAFAYNSPAAPKAVAAVAEVFSSSDPSLRLYEFAKEIGAPIALGDYGLKPEDARKTVDVLLAKGIENPRQLEQMPLVDMMMRIIDGSPPNKD